MPQYVAFLRAVNVGGRIVKMDELCAHFAAAGCSDVETFIASGNVSFSAKSRTRPAVLERTIEAHLHDALGYAVATFLRTPYELVALTNAVPFDASEMAMPGHRVHVGFLRSPPTAALRRTLADQATPMDAFGTGSRELYWLCRGPSLETQARWPDIEKALSLDFTMRNLNTVARMVARYG